MRMPRQIRLARLLLGTDPRLRRMLGYWAGTGALYFVCMGLMWLQVESGGAARDAIVDLCYLATFGLMLFFFLVRASGRLGIAPGQLAVLQALFAIACNVGAYIISGPLRGAWLMLLLVVMVFCTFSLRPRQTLLLCATAIGALAATIGYLVLRQPDSHPLGIEAMHFVLATASLVAVTVLTGEMSKLRSRLKRQKEELLEAVATIRKLATLDELTSLANRRHMNEVLSAEERRERHQQQVLCIALLDIDFFKRVNDRHGHAVGDAVLRTFARAARAELRAADVLARWGGEEFLLMLPDTELAEADQVLKRMAARVAAMRIDDLELELTITFSGGLVVRNGGERFADTISRADKALYHAKSSGRNRVITA
jgi:diguanylate cyclase (GGDEF)-like protein